MLLMKPVKGIITRQCLGKQDGIQDGSCVKLWSPNPLGSVLVPGKAFLISGFEPPPEAQISSTRFQIAKGCSRSKVVAILVVIRLTLLHGHKAWLFDLQDTRLTVETWKKMIDMILLHSNEPLPYAFMKPQLD